MLGVLEREHKRARLSHPQQLAFALLRALVYSLPPVVGALLVVRGVVSNFLQIAFTLLILALPAVILVNLPLIGKAVRQLRLCRSLDLLRVGTDFWIRGRRPRQGRSVRALLFLGPPLALLLVFLASVLFTTHDDSLAVTPAQTVLVLLLCVGLPFATYGFERLLAQLQDRLDHFLEVHDLRDRLAQLHGGSAGQALVEVPRDFAQRLADVERLRILEQRAEAMRGAGPEAEEYWAVAKTPAARRACRTLASGDRVRVEEAILKLSRDPPLGGAGEEERGAERVLEVPEAGVAIHYVAEAAGRRIEIRAVVPLERGEAE